MDQIPPEEQYETDTIFSQEGDLPDSYLQNKLKDVEPENEVGMDKPMSYYTLLPEEDEEDNDHDYRETEFVSLPNPPKKFDDDGVDSFEKLVKQSQFRFGNHDGGGDQLFCLEDELYDVTQDSFRYGRVTTGVSYNVMTGRMKDDLLEKVKLKDEEDDKLPPTCASSSSTSGVNNNTNHFNNSETVTSEVTISLNNEYEDEKLTFFDLYDSQMPKYFEYKKQFPNIHGIWTLFFNQDQYTKLSTFELQAGICAALNSKRLMMMCIGVDSYNSITGVEMTPTDRVIFRMALTRAVAGEFQPPLVKVPTKHLTGVLPMKRDVSEFTSMIDVVFIPILSVPENEGGAGDSENCEKGLQRYLIVVRVKELSEKLHQLSSGRIYTEENEQVVELSCIDEAFRVLIAEKEVGEENPPKGSLFMLEPEVFDESLESYPELEQLDEDSENDEDQVANDPLKTENDDAANANYSENYEKMISTESMLDSLFTKIDFNRAETFLWTIFGVALTVGAFKIVRSIKK